MFLLDLNHFRLVASTSPYPQQNNCNQPFGNSLDTLCQKTEHQPTYIKGVPNFFGTPSSLHCYIWIKIKQCFCKTNCWTLNEGKSFI